LEGGRGGEEYVTMVAILGAVMVIMVTEAGLVLMMVCGVGGCSGTDELPVAVTIKSYFAVVDATPKRGGFNFGEVWV
jgi:hypothetical protein